MLYQNGRNINIDNNKRRSPVSRTADRMC